MGCRTRHRVGRPPVDVHAGHCSAIGKRRKPISRDEARRRLLDAGAARTQPLHAGRHARHPLFQPPRPLPLWRADQSPALHGLPRCTAVSSHFPTPDRALAMTSTLPPPISESDPSTFTASSSYAGPCSGCRRPTHKYGIVGLPLSQWCLNMARHEWGRPCTSPTPAPSAANCPASPAPHARGGAMPDTPL
ncbi:DUF6233 domain-containing protein [Streptomyces tauricus]